MHVRSIAKLIDTFGSQSWQGHVLTPPQRHGVPLTISNSRSVARTPTCRKRSCT